MELLPVAGVVVEPLAVGASAVQVVHIDEFRMEALSAVARAEVRAEQP